MDIVVVSKPGCPRCLLAKDKLVRMNLAFREAEPHEIPKDIADAEFPVIVIDGVVHGYPSAMRYLKEQIHA